MNKIEKNPLEERPVYAEKVLFVIDTQNDFFTMALKNESAIKIIPNIIEKLKDFTGLVYFTRDTHEENYLETQEGKNLPVPHCIKDTEGWEIIPELRDYVRANSVIDKPTFGSFELGKKLKYVPDEIELVGVCTDICVVTNALILKAMFPETVVTVDASCCAGVTPESHKAALLTMKMSQVNIINE